MAQLAAGPTGNELMTKNLGNAKPSAPAKEINPSLFSKAAPTLFPLVVAAVGYLVGRHFFGF